MEVIRTIGSVMGSIKMLVDLIAKNRELAGAVATGLRSMIKDFELIRTVRLQRKQQQLQLTPGMELLLQELAYDIDDFIQGLWDPGPCGSFILLAIRADSRALLIQRISGFKESIKNLKDELPKSFEAIPAGPSSSAGSPIPCSPEVDLVGMEGPKGKIVELLAPRVEPHLARLTMISIFGCSGSGKTALAWALYKDEDVVPKDFDYKAWVVASDLTSAAILDKIRKEAVPRCSNPEAHHFQKDKRYLVFLDDVQRGTPWEDIQDAFRENVKDSRIIFTTRVPSVARDNSSGSYEYTMQGLDKDKSTELFCRKYWKKPGYSDEDKHRLGEDGVDVIVNKCDGLPIALISAAECLSRKGQNPVKDDFTQVCQELRDHLACSDCAFKEFQDQNGIEATFAEMRRARVEPYENQLNNGEKECLLYLSIFPRGHQINSNSLIRRLIAEGLVPRDPDIVKAPEFVVADVRECVRKLMDQRMIEPVPIRNYSNVAKRCRVHSIMLQFTIKRAASRNFVSQIHNDQPLRSTTGLVRRLTIQSSPEVGSKKPPEGIVLSVLRSLAIFDSGILNLKECRRVRVLDLDLEVEGCPDLDNICGLPLLKYLRLRNNRIPEFPQNVTNLKSLETLDTRGTADKVVTKLPVEVLMLPRFAYLFGKFELTNVRLNNTKELTKFLEEKKSQLHTLGGIVVHETKGLEIVLLVLQLATKLKKVKVWYTGTPSSRDLASDGTGPGLSRPKGKWFPTLLFRRRELSAGRRHGTSSRQGTPEPFPCVSGLVEALKERYLDLESVSVDFNGVTNTFLDFLQIGGTISSMKLRGGLGNFPKELGKVGNLRKLHLFSTGLNSNELAALQYLKCLQYLKLAEDGRPGLWDSVFHVQVGGFISLIWLCFESSNSLHPPLKIDEGVKTALTSLLLLCEESKGPQTETLDPIIPQMESGDPQTETLTPIIPQGESEDPQKETLLPISPQGGSEDPETETLVLISTQKEIEERIRAEGISHLAKLNEVILHKEVSTKIVDAWKEAAKKHINRPYVEKQQV